MTCCEIAYIILMLEAIGLILDGFLCFFVFQLFLGTSLHNEHCLFNL